MEKFNQKLEAFNRKNIHSINGDKMLSRVRLALNYRGKERDKQLANILLDNFPAEAKEYEEVRCQRSTYSKFNYDDERNMFTCNESQFLTGYADVLSACVQELDPTYRHDYMFGIGRDQAKKLLEDMMASYTCRDNLRDEMINYNGYRTQLEDIEFMKYKVNTNIVRNYAEEESNNGLLQGNMRELYMRKEILKDEMKQRNFLWRWFSRDARAMRKYVKTAEEALKAVQFPPEAEALAKEEMKAPAVRANYRKDYINSVDVLFDKHEARYAEVKNKQEMLTVGFKPDRKRLDDYFKSANEMEEMFKADKGKLAPEVKEVFNMNCEKLRLMQKAIEEKRSNESVDNYASGREFEIEKKYPNSKFINYEEIEKEFKKEQISIDVNQLNGKEETEPKKEEPASVKESFIKETI